MSKRKISPDRDFKGPAPLCTSVKVPLPRAPVPMVRRLFQIANAISIEAFASEDLSVLEFAVMQFLLREPELDQISLALRIGVDRTNIGVILDQMEKRGLVERQINPQDRRARLLRLSAHGKEVLTRIQPQTAIVREKLFAPLSNAEREQFYDILERMIAANETYSQPGAGRRRRSSG